MMTIEIFVIQTPGNTERTTSLHRELASQEGIDISNNGEIPFHFTKAIMDHAMARRGISKSHRTIVQKAKEMNLDEVLILEDDVQFLDKNALLKFINMSKIVPKDCDLFFAGIYDGKIEEEFSAYAKVTEKISGLHCYIVKKKFYDTFLSADVNYDLDGYISTQTNAVSYCAYPFLAIQYDGYSYNLKGKSAHNYKLHTRYKLTNYGK